MERLKGLKIGVFMGGNSLEREISLLSGKGVASSLRDEGLEVREVDLTTEDISEIKRIIEDFAINIVFIALHGRFGEDGRLQSILERLNIPYTGSDSRGSLNAMDKFRTRLILKEQGIRQPLFLFADRDWKPRLPFEGKLVVKPRSQGSSIGLNIVDTFEDLSSALNEVFKIDDYVLIEKFIEGKEITVGILEDRPLPPIGINPLQRLSFDFSSKYNPSLTEYELPAKINERLWQEAQELALKVHLSLGLRDFSRIDMRLSEKGEIFVLEANSIPGLTPTSLLPKAAKLIGLDYASLCIKMLEMALESRVRR